MAQSNLATGDRPAGKGASETSGMTTASYEISLSREDNARLLEVAQFLNKAPEDVVLEGVLASVQRSESEVVVAALRNLAEVLGESPSEERLAEIAPLVEQLIHARPRECVDLGETEPAFGLRFDEGA